MLNKLLKRCMPWMDKGRWYKLVLTGTSDNYVVDHDKSDSIFMDTSSSYDSVDKAISLSETPVAFNDIKCMDGPGRPTFISTSYWSKRYHTSISLYEGWDMKPYEGRELTLWMFGG